MMKSLALRLGASLCAVLLAGCSQYNMEAQRRQMEQGAYAEAVETLKKDLEPVLPDLLELGLVAHYANDYETSNNAFAIAEAVSEDLYTRRLSTEAAALATNDTVRPYPGSRVERLLIHYYRALNYVYDNDVDDALVEARRGLRLIQYYEGEDDGYAYEAAAFIAYFAGMLFEWAGETNDAFTSYRAAEQYYSAYGDSGGVKAPPDIGRRLVLLARQLNFTEEAELYENRYGAPDPSEEGRGELVILYESGFGPHKEEANIVIPILKADTYDDESDREKHRRQADEYAASIYAGVDIDYLDAELDYLLRIALPTLKETPPALTAVEASAAGVQAGSALAEDINEASERTYRSEMPGMLLRAILRGVVKHKAHGAAKRQGEGAEIAMELFNFFSENADTRSWQTLPALVSVLRMELPPGTHAVQLRFTGGKGGGQTHTVPDVEILPNRMTIFNFRTYE